MQKVLVTGGAGYIGSHTVVELLSAGFLPVIVDNFSNSKPFMLDQLIKLTGKVIPFYEGDCSDEQFLQSVFQAENNISGVIHFAAFKAVGESVSNPLKYYKNNLGSLLNVLSVMKEHGVSKLVFSSSATVYGNATSYPIMESAPRQQAASPYGATKIMCEDIIKDATKADFIQAVILRYFNPIGAHSSGLIGELPLGTPNNLVPYVSQAAAGLIPPLTVFGSDYDTPDGTCVRDYIHVTDLARAHIAALNYADEATNPFEVFNVGSGVGTSVKELLSEFERVNSVPVPKKDGPRRNGDIPICYADVSKINKLMHWQTQYTVGQALKDVWVWQQKLATLE